MSIFEKKGVKEEGKLIHLIIYILQQKLPKISKKCTVINLIKNY